MYQRVLCVTEQFRLLSPTRMTLVMLDLFCNLHQGGYVYSAVCLLACTISHKPQTFAHVISKKDVRLQVN